MASNDDGGVWRTIGGRRVFIKDGEDLQTAMNRSGKFKQTTSKNKIRNKNKKKKKELEDKKRIEDEYKLYKKAKENPDSIDPMTENSTDWEKLDKDYSSRYNKEVLEKSISKNPTNNFVDEDDVIGKDGERLNVSLNKYMDKDGNLTPEREKLHQEIINSYFEGKTPVPEGERVYYMTGGGAGSGKSRFVNDTGKYYGKDFEVYKSEDNSSLFKGNMIKLDADEIKIKLGLDKDDPTSAGYLHGESSALVKRITKVAQDNGYNVMLDGTGDGGINGMIKKIDMAHEKGYKVYANYGTIPVEEALERNWNRYIGAKANGENARLVSGEDVVRTHSAVSRILPELSKKFDGVKLWDNSGKDPVLIAEGGNGVDLKVNSSYNKEYLAFLEKAKYNSGDYDSFYDERLKEEEKWIEEWKKKQNNKKK